MNGNYTTKAYELISKEENELLKSKLKDIYKRSIGDGLSALRNIEKERFSKLISVLEKDCQSN